MYPSLDTSSKGCIIVTPKLGLPLVCSEPIDTTKLKIRTRKELLLAAEGRNYYPRNTGDFSQSSVSLNSNIWKILS